MRLWVRPRAPFWRLFVWVSAGGYLLAAVLRTVADFGTLEWSETLRWGLTFLLLAVLFERTERK